MTEKEKKGEFTQIPNYFLDILPYFLETKSAILVVIIRQTFGWQGRRHHNMSIKFLSEATGKTKRQVVRALNELKAKQIIINYNEEDEQKGKYVINDLGLNPHYSEWAGYDEYVIQINKRKKRATYDTSVTPTYDTSVTPAYDTSVTPAYDTSVTQINKRKINNKYNLNKENTKEMTDDFKQAMELFQ